MFKQGGALPKKARTEELRKSMVQISNEEAWLNTNVGDIHDEYYAWRDREGRFTIGWDLEDGKILRVYYYKGTPRWQREKMVPIKWPRSNTIAIDVGRCMATTPTNAEQAVPSDGHKPSGSVSTAGSTAPADAH